MSFQPAFAFRTAHWLSIGGGSNVMLGFLRTKAGVNNLDPRLGDGQVKYQDYTVNVGGNISIMVTPREGTRIGIDYLTPVNLNFSDVPHFKGLGPAVTKALSTNRLLAPNVDLGIQAPQQVMGRLLVRRGHQGEALGRLAAAARLDPASARFMYVYAVALNDRGQTEEAIRVLEASVARHPYDRESQAAPANFYRRAGDPEKALQ